MKKTIKIQLFDSNIEVIEQIGEILEKEGRELGYCEEYTETYECGFSRTLSLDDLQITKK